MSDGARALMAAAPDVLAALGLGVALGLFYFGTLWLVVRRLPRVPWPALWLVLSALVRLAVVLAGFVVLAGERWERWVAAVVGFVAVRVLLLRRLGGRAAAPARSERSEA